MTDIGQKTRFSRHREFRLAARGGDFFLGLVSGSDVTQNANDRR